MLGLPESSNYCPFHIRSAVCKTLGEISLIQFGYRQEKGPWSRLPAEDSYDLNGAFAVVQMLVLREEATIHRFI